MMPRGSGENHRISPPSTAMGNQPLAYADSSSSLGIILGPPGLRALLFTRVLPEDEQRAPAGIEDGVRMLRVLAIAGLRLHDCEIDVVALRIPDDFRRALPGPQRDADAEPVLILDRNVGGETFPRLHFHRLMHLRQPLGAHLGRPAGA